MSSPLFLRDRARRLRRDQTDAERQLWMHLRRHQSLIQTEAVLTEIQNRL